MSDYVKLEQEIRENKKQDAINPSHYKDVYPFEVITMIREMLTPEQFVGFCLGNEIKYRMRAGLKSSKIEEDIKKALWYKEARNVNLS